MERVFGARTAWITACILFAISGTPHVQGVAATIRPTPGVAGVPGTVRGAGRMAGPGAAGAPRIRPGVGVTVGGALRVEGLPPTVGGFATGIQAGKAGTIWRAVLAQGVL